MNDPRKTVMLSGSLFGAKKRRLPLKALILSFGVHMFIITALITYSLIMNNLPFFSGNDKPYKAVKVRLVKTVSNENKDHSYSPGASLIEKTQKKFSSALERIASSLGFGTKPVKLPEKDIGKQRDKNGITVSNCTLRDKYNPCDNPPPDYPAAAKELGLEGLVVIKVKVSKEGLPLSSSIAASSGHKILDEAAIESVLKWKFIPAKKNGKPINGYVQIPIEFRIKK